MISRDAPDWLRAPLATQEAQEAFAEHTRVLTRLYFHWLGFAIAGAALLWWPLDWVIYDDPHVIETFGRFRAIVIALDLTLAVSLPRLAVIRRHAHLTAVFACMLNLGLAGWTLAELAVAGADLQRPHVPAEAARHVVVLAVDVGRHHAAQGDVAGARRHRGEPASREQHLAQRAQAQAGLGP